MSVEVVIRFEADPGVTIEQAEAAAELLVTMAPPEVGAVLTYQGTEVTSTRR